MLVHGPLQGAWLHQFVAEWAGPKGRVLNLSWQNRAQFFGLAAQLMRHILVDHARSHHYAKRGGGAQRVPLEEAAVLSPERGAELVALDEALKRLETDYPRQCRIVELRYFGGLTVEETAEVMKVSSETVMRDWKVARRGCAAR